MCWHAGEQLRLRISGRVLLRPILPGLVEKPLQSGDRHVLHTNGQVSQPTHASDYARMTTGPRLTKSLRTMRMSHEMPDSPGR